MHVGLTFDLLFRTHANIERDYCENNYCYATDNELFSNETNCDTLGIRIRVVPHMLMILNVFTNLL